MLKMMINLLGLIIIFIFYTKSTLKIEFYYKAWYNIIYEALMKPSDFNLKHLNAGLSYTYMKILFIHRIEEDLPRGKIE